MRVLSEAGAFTAPGAGSGVHWAEHLRVRDLSVATYSIAARADDGIPAEPGSVEDAGR
jgi:hypothetical protein